MCGRQRVRQPESAGMEDAVAPSESERLDTEDLEAAGRRGAGLSELMKKALLAGIGAVFMTEESVRGYVREARLPREIARLIIDNTQAAKEQFFRYLARELSELVRRSDLPAALLAFFREHTIEVHASIRFRASAAEQQAAAAAAPPGRAEPPGGGEAGSAPDAAGGVAVPPPAGPAAAAPGGEQDGEVGL
ncbi:MAG: hypothetical protein KatS3mg102_0855 [Planctomycetota bacterium]|nr:MAG: hypothetical protein KatS3mg102_0855 [Planctomycetota bacterium]